MKPVGLTNPRGPKPRAIVQLRQDNALGTLYNMVGFQTKLTHGAQTRIFRMIPGLEHAEFARLGFAGQITGCEGYVESAAVGLIAGRFAAADRLGRVTLPPPATTALGALLGHIPGGANTETYQPMNVNFGLFPPLSAEETGAKKRLGGRE